MRGMVTTYFQSKGGAPKVGTRVEFALAEPTKIGKDQQCVNIGPLPQENAGGGAA